jgi:AcrR family transcriptional regulator
VSGTDKTKPSTGPGRPPVLSAVERRKLILKAAQREFFEHGFAATSMEQVARACGMSKKSIYHLFTNKMELFEALLQSIPKMDYAHSPTVQTVAEVQGWIEIILADFIRFVMAPDQLAITRLAIAESHTSPELARLFYQNHFAPNHASLVQKLTQLQEAGMLGDADPAILADVLISTALGAGHLKALLSGVPQTDEMLDSLGARLSLVLENVWRQDCPAAKP